MVQYNVGGGFPLKTLKSRKCLPDLTSTHLAEQLSLVLVWPLLLTFPLLTLALFCLR